VITEEIAQFVEDRLAEEKSLAVKASGGTVTGEPGNWRPAPTGDEWEVHADLADTDFGKDGDLEILVALRPGLARPPQMSEGYWGAVVSWRSDGGRENWVPEPQFRHMAWHDPALALRRVRAVRSLLALFTEMGYNEEPAYRAAAATWSDHPAYKPEWAPES
jgi:hypothetical protein